ncbi:MAG: hypothetical protein IKW83_08940 [Muribaculaceae bacterium]|nr:hypothetical protein [Muribaculaceae bacterium]
MKKYIFIVAIVTLIIGSGVEASAKVKKRRYNARTSKTESPMKVPEQSKKDTKPQQETNTQADTLSEAQKRAEEQMSGMKKGNNGNAQSGEGEVSVKANGELGNFPVYFQGGTCPGEPGGSVIVKVQIDPITGKISNAQVVGGTLQHNKKACERCIEYALNSRFAVSNSKVLPPFGTLIYIVK